MVSAKQAKALQGDYGQLWSPECLGMVSFLQEIPAPCPDALGLFAMGQLCDAAAPKAPCSSRTISRGFSQGHV